MTQGDSKYGEQALFMYFITNSTISRKSYLFPYKVYKSEPKIENSTNKLTAWAACGTNSRRIAKLLTTQLQF